jgi:hypothetical protein
VIPKESRENKKMWEQKELGSQKSLRNTAALCNIWQHALPQVSEAMSSSGDWDE